ncbi:MAG: Fe-S protein assembly co-chaperone HscB [Alphaproteobacteria bacterium]|nr:Fe-S protein assembly co-chaperone HscB [Alphaproteobacteria bacterium]
MGIPQEFDIDLQILEQRYFILQREFHPDRFAHQGGDEDAMSVAINQAYRILKNPVFRAKALLECAGCFIGETENLSDISFLQDQWEWRERIEESTTPDDLDLIKNDLEKEFLAIQHVFSKAWIAKKSEQMLQIYRKLSYFSKALERVKEKSAQHY